MNVVSSILYFIGEKIQRMNGIEEVPFSPASGELSLAVAKHNSDNPSKPVITQDTISVPASGSSLIGVDYNGNISTYPNKEPVWGTVNASKEFNPSTSQNYFSITYNNNEETSHNESGLEYDRKQVTIASGRNSTSSYFKIPAGVSWIEVCGYAELSNGTSDIRRYSIQACVSQDLTVAPTTNSIYTLATTLTPASTAPFSLQGSRLIPVNEGDYVFVRGYKVTASSAQTVSRGGFYIKAIA
jgi:hypothetical protein